MSMLISLTGFAYSSKLTARNNGVLFIDRIPSPGCDLGMLGTVSAVFEFEVELLEDLSVILYCYDFKLISR